jgi:hypothetical protein
MSLRVKAFVSPCVSTNPSAGMPMIRTAPPPEMYWHSRQWHCARIAGSPVARYRTRPQ